MTSANPNTAPQANYIQFLDMLRLSVFSGDIANNYASRISYSTDNSIYQTIPQAIVFPKTTADITLMLTLGAQKKFHDITFAPRGGGTGTNGQSLTTGIIVDCSRYMTKILALNITEGWVKVQPGIILEQLNNYLKPHGYFFAPHVSTANRATIGGMINTNASGIGSALYGTTYNHVLDIQAALVSGELFSTQQTEQENARLTPIYQQLKNTIEEHQQQIDALPELIRPLSGYNLRDSYNAIQQQYDLNALLCGSEGTLGIITEVSLKLTPLPQYRQAIAIKYNSFEEALQSAVKLTALKPSAIESLDERILNLARQDICYYDNEALFDYSQNPCSIAMNFLEFSSNNQHELEQMVAALITQLKQNHIFNYYLTQDETDRTALWNIRKKSVGLSANLAGERQPIAFVEDTLVAPSDLPEFIKEFKVILDDKNIHYAMYGHADSGCMHVRPALNLRDPNDVILMKDIEQQVLQLVQKYHGILWGEHGKGYRTQYIANFFGHTLYTELQKIKAMFDPDNRLNPGKLVAAYQSNNKFTQPQLKASRDQQIPATLRKQYSKTIACNGNGYCFNQDTHSAMCPSYKATNDRVHSPKGRATLIREWLRLSSSKTKAKETKHFSNEVYQALHGCLGCKACASECPIHINIPHNKYQFLYQYHQHQRRTIRDHIIARLEKWTPRLNQINNVYNYLNHTALSRWLTQRYLKLTDMPMLNATKTQTKANLFNKLATLSPQQRERTVLILPDVFTQFYNSPILLDSIQLLSKLGINVITLPYSESGKSWHIYGFKQQFEQIAQRNIEFLTTIAQFNIPIIGLEPSIALIYRDEYQRYYQQPLPFRVNLLQEWLQTTFSRKISANHTTISQHYQLYLHCTEKALVPNAAKQWQAIFELFGLSLEIVQTGCCGMAGSYGHQVEHYQHSKKLFALYWKNSKDTANNILMTGYSCRSQAQRFQGMTIQHPAQALLKHIANSSAFPCS